MPDATAAPKILIAEEDRTVATDLESRLTALGYEVVAIASSGHEALELAERTRPRLALVDVALGGEMDGIETARAIRRRDPIPVLFTIAETDEGSLRRAEVRQQCGHLLKPFADRELRVALAMALSGDGGRGPSDEFEERYFDLSIDLLCCLGFDGHFARLSPAWERTLGFTREELKARPFIEFVHPDDRERTLAQNRGVRDGEQALSFENRYLCKDGSYRWLAWNAAPDSDRRVIYSVARDVTEPKRAEAERELLVAQLQTALAEVQTLRDFLPICSYCKHVRDDQDYWQSVEAYIAKHTNTRFSHSICPDCFERVIEPQLQDG